MKYVVYGVESYTLLKFRFSEKGTKIWPYHPHGFDVTRYGLLRKPALDKLLHRAILVQEAQAAGSSIWQRQNKYEDFAKF